MEALSDNQAFKLALILATGFIVGAVAGWQNKNASLWLLKYGLIVCFAGIVGSAIAGSLKDTLLLIDSSGIGRAYVIGCAIIVSGIIARLFHYIRSLL